MRVLVIGGTGFIGRYVVARLAERTNEVAVFHRGETPAALPTGVSVVKGDYRNAAQLRACVEAAKPDTVVHMAAYTEADGLTLMDACRGRTERVVVISSQDVYRAFGRVRRTEEGPPEPTPIDEDAQLRRALYLEGQDYEKLLVERAVGGAAELPATILRLPVVYGPGDAKQHRLHVMLKRMDDGRAAILFDAHFAAWRWTRGYVENVADAIAIAATDGPAAGRVYNVGDPDAPTMAAWARMLADVTGWHGEIVVVPADQMPPELVFPVDTTQHLEVDTSRIRRELDLPDPIPRDKALRRTVEWERAHPPADINLYFFNYAAEDRVLESLPSEF